MGNAFVSSLFHIVFSTKNRQPWLDRLDRRALDGYFIGTVARQGTRVLFTGGTSDHVHLIVSLGSAVNLAQTLQHLKGGSSHWIHNTYSNLAAFSWQEGYGAFSIGKSQVEPTRQYITRQEEHHKKVSFQDEFRSFLHANGMALDEKTFECKPAPSVKRASGV